VTVSRWSLVGLAAFALLAWVVTEASVVAIVVATVVLFALMKIGFGVLRGFAAPVHEPPPAGELRKVRLNYRCSICATEVRMTMANDQMPDPPRHCLEDMDLVTPVEDL
jgi:hypothetical protein